MPRTRFQEILIVPDGPPESVWERALDAAFANTEQDAVPDGDPPESAGSGLVHDPATDLLQTGDHASDSHPTTHDDSSGTWDDGNGVADAGHDDGDGLPDVGHGLPDDSDGLTGGGDDVGY